MIHRDVKPSNILLDDDDYAYLIDFGIARAATDTGLTGTGSTIGTWAYMAPERFASGQIDPRGDIYALACVLHESLTGTSPFPGESFEQLDAGHMFAAPPRPSRILPGIPAPFDDVVATDMANDPNHRYPTTIELAAAAHAASVATPPPPPSPAAVTRHRPPPSIPPPRIPNGRNRYQHQRHPSPRSCGPAS